MTALTRARCGSLAVALAGALAAGCGVPSHTDVEVAGAEGPSAGAEPVGGVEPRVPPGPDEADGPEQLVRYFLQGAAGDPRNAVEELRPFIYSDEQESWQPKPEVQVVRIDDSPTRTPVAQGVDRVRLGVRTLGTLSNGVVEPESNPEESTVEFEVAIDPGASAASGDLTGLDPERPQYRIVDPPDRILLDERALIKPIGPRRVLTSGYLRPTSVYFWDRDRDVLVPDLRWMPTALPPAQRAQTKLEWLIAGPASWLESLATVPGDLELEGNPVWRGDRLDITLAAADGVDLQRLDTQLWWSLRDELPSGNSMWLTINGEQRQVNADGRIRQAIRYSEPRSFVLLDGAVVPYVPSDEVVLPEGAVIPDAQAVAMTGEGDGVALAQVHPGPDGLLRLTVSTVDGEVTTDLRPATTMSRPVWLKEPGRIGLVAADGRLYSFTVDGAVDEVPVPNGAITAFAVAPDGRRLALVAGGALYTTSLRRGDGAVGVNTPRPLPTTVSDLSGVAFIQENWLAIIGQDGGETLLYELTVDGASEHELLNLGAPETVSSLVGFPGDPYSDSAFRGTAMYEADGLAYRHDYPSEPIEIITAEFDLDADPAVEPRAPFFAE